MRNRKRAAVKTAGIIMAGSMAFIGTMIHAREEPAAAELQAQLPISGIARTLEEYMTVPLEEETELSQDTVAEEDIELLARLIYAEVGSIREDACLYACGSVVLNRVASEEFPDTLAEVIYQTEPTVQYICTKDGNINKEPDDRCMEIAEDLLRNGTTIPADVIYQAEFAQGSGIYAVYENVIYSYR